jgi:hypothetical protein
MRGSSVLGCAYRIALLSSTTVDMNVRLFMRDFFRVLEGPV